MQTARFTIHPVRAFFVRLSLTALILFFISKVAYAQNQAPAPDSQGMILLKRIADVYGALNSYSDFTELYTETKLPFVTIAQTSTWKVAFSRPDRISVTGGIVWVVSDSQWRWKYIAPLNQFTKQDAPAILDPGMLADIDEQFVTLSGAANVPVMLVQPKPLAYVTEGVKSASVEGAEEVAGKACSVLLINRAQEGRVKAWVGTEDSIIYRVELDLTGGLRKTIRDDSLFELASARAVITHKNVELNQALSDDAFAFKPLPGAREINDVRLQEEPSHQLIGKPAPNFELTGFDGKVFKLSDTAGKPLAICFWRSGELPSGKALETLSGLSERFPQVVFIGINSEPAEKAKIVQEEAQAGGFPTFPDPDRKVQMAYMTQGLPTVFIVAPDGAIKQVILGYRRNMSELIADTLRSLVTNNP